MYYFLLNRIFDEWMFTVFGIVGAVVIALPFIIKVATKQKKKTLAAWKEAAKQLGLNADPKRTLITGSCTSAEGAKQFECKIWTFVVCRGESSSRYTKFQVMFDGSFGVGLNIGSEGAFNKFTKLFGAQDMQIFDDEFDKAFVVKGDDPNEIRHVLTHERKIAILNASQVLPKLAIDKDGAHWTTGGTIRDTQQLVSTMQVLIELADAISKD
jgi:hypothetical protein